MMTIDREKLNRYWRTYEAARAAWWRSAGWDRKVSRGLREQLRVAKQELFQARAEMVASPSGRGGRAVVAQLAQNVEHMEAEWDDQHRTEDERTWLEQWEEAGGWR